MDWELKEERAELVDEDEDVEDVALLEEVEVDENVVEMVMVEVESVAVDNKLDEGEGDAETSTTGVAT